MFRCFKIIKKMCLIGFLDNILSNSTIFIVIRNKYMYISNK